jgi:CRP/FNR family transcriptional regulator, cyclic AMP receptor protein
MRPEVPAKRALARATHPTAPSAMRLGAPARLVKEENPHFSVWRSPAALRRMGALAADTIFAKIHRGISATEYRDGEAIFRQGAPSDAIFYLRKGRVKLAVVSSQGKEAIIAILDAGSFFGEACLEGQAIRTTTARAIREASVIRIEKEAMVRLLRENPRLSEFLIAYLLIRNIRIEEDLVDHLFNSAEKRLARILLLLANIGKEGSGELVIPRISQETLAEMVGTTRARVNYFMNKFRRMGLIDYNGGFHVHSSLLNVVLRD